MHCRDVLNSIFYNHKISKKYVAKYPIRIVPWFNKYLINDQIPKLNTYCLKFNNDLH